jgi:hypothetical protein
MVIFNSFLFPSNFSERLAMVLVARIGISTSRIGAYRPKKARLKKCFVAVLFACRLKILSTKWTHLKNDYKQQYLLSAHMTSLEKL